MTAVPARPLREEGGVESHFAPSPPHVPAELLSELCESAERIVGLIDAGEPCAEEIASFNEATRGAYGRANFGAYPGAEATVGFVKRALRPQRPRVPDITRAELAEIVRRIRSADPETDYYLLLFDTNTPHPRATDLVFWPPDDLGNATPEEIVEAAMGSRPFETGRSGDA